MVLFNSSFLLKKIVLKQIHIAERRKERIDSFGQRLSRHVESRGSTIQTFSSQINNKVKTNKNTYCVIVF